MWILRQATEMWSFWTGRLGACARAPWAGPGRTLRAARCASDAVDHVRVVVLEVRLGPLAELLDHRP